MEIFHNIIVVADVDQMSYRFKFLIFKERICESITLLSLSDVSNAWTMLNWYRGRIHQNHYLEL